METVTVYAVGRLDDVRTLDFGPTARLFLAPKVAVEYGQAKNAEPKGTHHWLKWYDVSYSEADRILRRHAQYLARI